MSDWSITEVKVITHKANVSFRKFIESQIVGFRVVPLVGDIDLYREQEHNSDWWERFAVIESDGDEIDIAFVDYTVDMYTDIDKEAIESIIDLEEFTTQIT